MRVAVWADSAVGKVRERQEDAFLVDLPLIAQADGMGGTMFGAMVSRFTIFSLQEAKPRTLDDLTGAVRRISKEADTLWHDSGATLDAVLLGEVVTGVHAGDSRIYWGRKRGRGPLARRSLFSVTQDHQIGRYLTNFVGTRDVMLDLVSIPWVVADFVILCSDGLFGELSDVQMADVLWSRTRNPARALVRKVVEDTPARDNVTAVVAQRRE